VINIECCVAILMLYIFATGWPRRRHDNLAADLGSEKKRKTVTFGRKCSWSEYCAEAVSYISWYNTHLTTKIGQRVKSSQTEHAQSFIAIGWKTFPVHLATN